MKKLSNLKVILSVMTFTTLYSSCTKRQPDAIPPIMEVHLHSGVGEIARLGDSLDAVKKRNQNRPYEAANISPHSPFNEIGLTQIITIPAVGARIYFRRGRVALIELQEPFRGKIFGKKIQLFSFSLPKGEGWRETLMREFGAPKTEMAGGRLGSHSLFYRWGDISYNKMGPNEISIHRDPAIGRFRESNFGRQIKLFGN